jgi:hypothetical protein
LEISERFASKITNSQPGNGEILFFPPLGQGIGIILGLLSINWHNSEIIGT